MYAFAQVQHHFCVDSKVVLGKFYNCVWIIFGRGRIGADKGAFFAFVPNVITLSRTSLDSNRLHHAATGSRTITWVDVDVLRPETLWAVVCVAISDHVLSAMRADEIFNILCKTHAI